MINYNNTKKLIEESDINFSTNFIFGLLSAYVCSETINNDWIDILQKDKKELSDDKINLFKNLSEIKDNILNDIKDIELSFELPINQDEPIKEQSLSTRDWVSGFWLGIKKMDLAKRVMDKNSLEFITDLPKIASIPLLEDENNENYNDLLQIQEYCKIGIINLFLSINKQ